jgi:hypothetical protein
MKYLIIFLSVFVLFNISFAAEDVANVTQSDTTTIIETSSTTESAALIEQESNETTQSSQIIENSSTNSNLISTTTTESLGEIVIETSPSPNQNPNSTQPNKRKTILINQQQNGKMNVQLELSDVSVIVIPNQKENPQLSLLNLLFKTAQKRQNEDRKKEENAMKSSDYHHDQYSKIHSSRPSNEDSYINEPFIESRAPYRVDISSTLGQQPVVEISSHSNPRKLKRAIDSRLLGMITTELDQQNTLGEDPIVNILRGEEEEALIDRNESEFHLLGATENCGPGRKRNSYQICVPIDYDEM